MIAPLLRRAAAAGAVALAVSVIFGPSALAAAPQGGISTPDAGEILTVAAPTIAGAYSQPSTAAGPGRVDEVTVRLRSIMGYPVPGGGLFTKQGDGSARLEFSWTTPELRYNGPYEAQAQAKGSDALDTNGQESSVISTVRFRLAVPPDVPTGLESETDPSAQRVTLDWDDNSEPDLIGYQVQRSATAGDSFEVVGEATDSTFVDAVPDPGNWRYRVVAVRLGASEDEAVTSDPSEPHRVTMESPPSTTTGGSSGGSSDTGSSGGSRQSSGPGSSRAIDSSGRVDMSEFGSLLEQNRRRARTAAPPDPGYDLSLPFDRTPVTEQLAEGDEERGPETDVGELGQSLVEINDESDQQGSLVYVAGALLMFVVAMQVLWLRGEVNRPEELDAVDPGSDPGTE